LTIEEERVTYVHASPWNPSEFPYIIHWYQAEMAFEALNTDLCFFGHTHVPIAIKRNREGDNEIIKQRKGWVQLDPESRYLINPGSVGQPRDNNPKASFIVFDEDNWRFRWIRVPYDTRKAQAGILDAGLPEENARRLEIH
jgi:predicted phosphodiesterase